jgi:hypothetical protein
MADCDYLLVVGFWREMVAFCLLNLAVLHHYWYCFVLKYQGPILYLYFAFKKLQHTALCVCLSVRDAFSQSC